MNAVRFSIAIVRLVVCTTIAPILLSTGTGSALAANSGPEKFSYDPSTCKTDAHGKLYIALGRNVLALPSSGAIIVARYGNDWLTPPDPTDSVGCPNNPEQLTGFGFPYAYNTAAGKENTPFPATHAARLDRSAAADQHSRISRRSARRRDELGRRRFGDENCESCLRDSEYSRGPS